MPDDGEIIYCLRESVGYIVLNRPELHNAISEKMWEQLPQVLQALKSSGAKVVVLTGSGQSFASGADLAELDALGSYAQARRLWHTIAGCLNSIYSFELPTIAMINGPCLGGGCLLALACDLRYASETASFAVPTARLGIVLDDANIARLLAAVGPLFTKELLFTGGTISSARAQAIGLVASVVEPAALEDVVHKAALAVAGNAPISMLQAKQSIKRLLGGLWNGQDEDLVIGSYLGSDFHERIARAQDDL